MRPVDSDPGSTEPTRARTVTVECATCVAANTTACADCVVAHLLANDDGPVEYVTVAPPTTARRRERDRAVALFVAAGLVDDPVEFVTPEEFGRADGREPVPSAVDLR